MATTKGQRGLDQGRGGTMDYFNYAFDEDEINNDDDGSASLRARGASRKNLGRHDDEIILFEHTIEAGDTLASVALKYRCPVAEIKRCNKLMQDQEFFALRTIKIPTKSHGLLTEQAAQNGALSKNAQPPPLSFEPSSSAEVYESDDFDSDGSDCERRQLVRTVGFFGPRRSGADRSSHTRFLEQMDRDISHIVSSTRTRLDSLEKVVETITCKSIQPMGPASRRGAWSGADCGISWRGIVAAAGAVAVLIPVLYFLYARYARHDA